MPRRDEVRFVNQQEVAFRAIPLGYLVVRTRVLPGYMVFVAIGLGSAFFALGVASLYSLVLPVPVLAFAGIQAFWWVAAAVLKLRPANVNS